MENPRLCHPEGAFFAPEGSLAWQIGDSSRPERASGAQNDTRNSNLAL